MYKSHIPVFSTCVLVNLTFGIYLSDRNLEQLQIYLRFTMNLYHSFIGASRLLNHIEVNVKLTVFSTVRAACFTEDSFSSIVGFTFLQEGKFDTNQSPYDLTVQ